MKSILASQINFARPPREISIRHRSLAGCSGVPGELGLGIAMLACERHKDRNPIAGEHRKEENIEALRG